MEFRLLGPVEVEEDGRALSLGGRRQRAVLTHLLLRRGTPVTSDELIEQVWGDAAPAAVRASLHTYVSRLRAELGAQRLAKRSQGYVLHAEPEEVDAVRFEQALALARSRSDEDAGAAAQAYEQALALSRGPALGELADEPCLEAEAARLDALVAAARREQVTVGLRLGRHAALLPVVEDLLRRNPLQEDLWGDYVLALYRCDRQADALTAFERARTTLRDELGIEPSPRLRALHAQVLRQDPDLSLAATALRGYRLLGVLGEGSSAVVHRAVQPHTGRDVALKALHPWLADDAQLVRRFAGEAQAALQLEHPNVVPLHDYWREPGGAFLAMRLMRGGSLAERLERGPVAVEVLVRIAEQVTGALDALLGRGVADAPVRLEDVLLDDHDNAYLSGFCLARQVAPAAVTAGAGRRPTVDAAPVGHLLLDVVARRPAGAPGPALALAEHAAAGGFADARELCAALRTALGPKLPAPRDPVEPMPPRNPYKGLRPFGEADAADFFGRADQVDALVARLAEATPAGPRRFLAVVGPSGSGKSSLVRAGLVPALRAGAVAGGPCWYVADLTPGIDPFAELVRALRKVAVRPLTDDVADALRDRPAGLAALVRSALPDDGGELLLVVDQFEELFTLVAEADRKAFVALLAAATAGDSRLRVVVTLRADFYDRPLGDPVLAELLRQGTEVVVPLTAQGLQEAVVEPAARAGLRVEPALLAQVVADVGDTSTALPLLPSRAAARARAADREPRCCPACRRRPRRRPARRVRPRPGHPRTDRRGGT